MRGGETLGRAAVRERFSEYLGELEEIERLPEARLFAYQQELLGRIVRHARQQVPFYGERLAPLFTGNDLDLSRWREVPLLERAEVIDHRPAMRAAEIPGGHGPVAEFRTSGTLGAPLTVAINGSVSVGMNANIARLIRWFGRNSSRPMASIKTYPGDEQARYPHGRTGKAWLIGGTAPHYALHVATPIAQQVEWLARVKPPFLITYPSNALALADAVSSARGRELGIEMVLGFGETVPEGTHETIEERFGAVFASYYSCQEIGAIAIECEARNYHVAVENAVVEIVGDDGAGVAPGERGRVVVTGLRNYAMPFMRYALGDVAVAGMGPCRCGRTLPVIARIEGRTRNAFIFRDGTRIWPRGWLAREMHAFVPFRQYQLVQLDHERIEFRYVPDGSGREPDVPGLAEYVKRMLHPSVEMSLKPMQTLPRAPGGKFEDFISLVGPPAAGGGARFGTS